MKAEDIRDGDIVEIDYIDEFTKEHINEGRALVIWKDSSQPLIIRLDREKYYPIWTSYKNISKVVGYIPIGEILKDMSDRGMDRCNKWQTGKWITEEIGEGRKVYCSECKESAVFEYVRDGDIYSSYGHGVVKKTKFCPNCGARMEREEQTK